MELTLEEVIDICERVANNEKECGHKYSAAYFAKIAIWLKDYKRILKESISKHEAEISKLNHELNVNRMINSMKEVPYGPVYVPRNGK